MYIIVQCLPNWFGNTLGTSEGHEMARAARDIRLNNRTNRLKLETGKRYYLAISEGLSLIYRRTDKSHGTWSARIKYNDGKDKMVRIGPADDHQDANGENILSFPQAQGKAREYASELNRPSHAIHQLTTVTIAIEHYMDWFRENRKSVADTERTIKAHILPAFGDKLVMDLTSLEIKRWHEKLANSAPRRRTRKGCQQNYGEKAATNEQKRSRKCTANRILSTFKAILNKAFEDGLAPDDKEWRRVKPFKKVEEPKVRFLTVPESTRLINACREDIRLLVQAALLTGCRYGELCRILTTHVNLDTGMVYISPEAKSGKGRHVPLNSEGLQFFKQQTTGKKGLEHVFIRKDGSPWQKNHQSRLMKIACEKARIDPPLGFHELRHTYASLLAQAGADLLTISKLLGHADTRVTSRHYAHLCDRTLTNAVKTLLPEFGVIPMTSKIASIR